MEQIRKFRIGEREGIEDKRGNKGKGRGVKSSVKSSATDLLFPPDRNYFIVSRGKICHRRGTFSHIIDGLHEFFKS